MQAIHVHMLSSIRLLIFSEISISLQRTLILLLRIRTMRALLHHIDTQNTNAHIPHWYSGHAQFRFRFRFSGWPAMCWVRFPHRELSRFHIPCIFASLFLFTQRTDPRRRTSYISPRGYPASLQLALGPWMILYVF